MLVNFEGREFRVVEVLGNLVIIEIYWICSGVRKRFVYRRVE